MISKTLCRLTVLLIALTPDAYALDLSHDVSLKGFGTLGIANSSTGNADFVANNTQQFTGGWGALTA